MLLIALATTFTLYTTYEEYTLSKIFTALSLMNLMRIVQPPDPFYVPLFHSTQVFIMLPSLFQSLSTTMASVNRIGAYAARPDAPVRSHRLIIRS